MRLRGAAAPAQARAYEPAVPLLSAGETAQVLRENEALHRENRLLELKVQKLERQLWSPESERYVPGDENQGRLPQGSEAPGTVAPGCGSQPDPALS